MKVHLRREKHDTFAVKGGNAHNGKTDKTTKGDFGNIPLDIPRDRNSNFQLGIIPKRCAEKNAMPIIGLVLKG